MYKKGVSTGVNGENRALIEDSTRFADTLPRWHRELFVDPQTSGGLMVSVPAEQGEQLLHRLHANGVEAARIIGSVRALQGSDYLDFV
jgi:selenide,water dikinase